MARAEGIGNENSPGTCELGYIYAPTPTGRVTPFLLLERTRRKTVNGRWIKERREEKERVGSGPDASYTRMSVEMHD